MSGTVTSSDSWPLNAYPPKNESVGRPNSHQITELVLWDSVRHPLTGVVGPIEESRDPRGQGEHRTRRRRYSKHRGAAALASARASARGADGLSGIEVGPKCSGAVGLAEVKAAAKPNGCRAEVQDVVDGAVRASSAAAPQDQSTRGPSWLRPPDQQPARECGTGCRCLQRQAFTPEETTWHRSRLLKLRPEVRDTPPSGLRAPRVGALRRTQGGRG